MAKKKVQTQEEKFEEIIESVDEGKKSDCLDSNRALKLEICDQIEKINNRYYLSIILKYIKQLGG